MQSGTLPSVGLVVLSETGQREASLRVCRIQITAGSWKNTRRLTGSGTGLHAAGGGLPSSPIHKGRTYMTKPSEMQNWPTHTHTHGERERGGEMINDINVTFTVYWCLPSTDSLSLHLTAHLSSTNRFPPTIPDLGLAESARDYSHTPTHPTLKSCQSKQCPGICQY